MKLRKTINTFSVLSIDSASVELSDQDGHVYKLYVGDKIESVHQINLQGAFHDQGCDGCAHLTESLIALGFSYPREHAQ